MLTNLPASALTQLRRTHAAGVELLTSHKLMAEAEEVEVQVERHRWFWRPNKPRILLVAESHVFTSDEDRKVRIDQSKISRFGKANASLPPESFVRLVYCLGYGETQLLKSAPAHLNNPGTPRYWDIFGRVTGRGPQPRPESGAELTDRLIWKIETLRQMCRQGIWLLDASVHAIYRGYGHRLPPAIKADLHRQWWNGYGRHVIASCGKTKVWVIGKTVYNCLSTLPGWRCRGWVYQPNAPEVNLNRNWPQLLEDCWQLRPD